MHRASWFAWLGSLLVAGGCASKHLETENPGLIDRSDRIADLRDDHIRLLGVDRAPASPLNQPFYVVPFAAFGLVIDGLIVAPCTRLYVYISGDDARRAAHQMVDPDSADNRRRGTLRLAEEKFAREGVAERDLWASMAQNDPDYTVRAAAIRALNWSRDPNHTRVFIDALADPHPLIRLEAAKGLANVPDPNAIQPLLERMQRDISEDVRIAAADALRCYKNDEVAHDLIGMLNDQDFAVAWQARQSLRLMTGYDFQYNEQAWLNYLSGSNRPFG